MRRAVDTLWLGVVVVVSMAIGFALSAGVLFRDTCRR